jgi:hypothetical protein
VPGSLAKRSGGSGPPPICSILDTWAGPLYPAPTPVRLPSWAMVPSNLLKRSVIMRDSFICDRKEEARFWPVLDFQSKNTSRACAPDALVAGQAIARGERGKDLRETDMRKRTHVDGLAHVAHKVRSQWGASPRPGRAQPVLRQPSSSLSLLDGSQINSAPQCQHSLAIT